MQKTPLHAIEFEFLVHWIWKIHIKQVYTKFAYQFAIVFVKSTVITVLFKRLHAKYLIKYFL